MYVVDYLNVCLNSVPLLFLFFLILFHNNNSAYKLFDLIHVLQIKANLTFSHTSNLNSHKYLSALLLKISLSSLYIVLVKTTLYVYWRMYCYNSLTVIYNISCGIYFLMIPFYHFYKKVNFSLIFSPQ